MDKTTTREYAKTNFGFGDTQKTQAYNFEDTDEDDDFEHFVSRQKGRGKKKTQRIVDTDETSNDNDNEFYRSFYLQGDAAQGQGGRQSVQSMKTRSDTPISVQSVESSDGQGQSSRPVSAQSATSCKSSASSRSDTRNINLGLAQGDTLAEDYNVSDEEINKNVAAKNKKPKQRTTRQRKLDPETIERENNIANIVKDSALYTADHTYSSGSQPMSQGSEQDIFAESQSDNDNKENEPNMAASHTNRGKSAVGSRKTFHLSSESGSDATDTEDKKSTPGLFQRVQKSRINRAIQVNNTRFYPSNT